MPLPAYGGKEEQRFYARNAIITMFRLGRVRIPWLGSDDTPVIRRQLTQTRPSGDARRFLFGLFAIICHVPVDPMANCRSVSPMRLPEHAAQRQAAKSFR
jgi:hypothetical protein